MENKSLDHLDLENVKNMLQDYSVLYRLNIWCIIDGVGERY